MGSATSNRTRESLVAVCLLTCNRRDYTETTLSSFTAHNDPFRFQLLHADDASEDDAVPTLARRHGFSTVLQTTRRRGWLEMRLALFHIAATRGAEWILFLENDHEWVRPFPWALFDYVQRFQQFYCLRLQGAYKDRDNAEACMVYHKDDRRKPVKWSPIKFAPEKAQVGRIHWSAQPSVTRTQALLDLHLYGMQSPDLTARVVENVTYHIGVQRTRDLDRLQVSA